ncbi:nitroreductase family deazaflavin-dependent oxidoreductase [Streptomyces sp. MNU76]|uniref:nitroreductase family deazaflavin-dependent oxidoreductase n=1 Tax=Streptomyces sp. MNU76 TaxID=2560026 RepID=UPI001E455F98|nr:nitroreductase family deazaflavin-dependent oxidoreductase [Streptomyces sp. MNU76]MCC9710917.1 nitroreductase family deazaflavin-dependent oxidoreductase [Streptomyces sp. MNU76]
MRQPDNATSHRPRLPSGWRRSALRLPILLFRAGLGPVFGRRFLLLHHTGRVTGADRHVALEVVAHDPAEVSWTVASGFGPKADWYRNLRHRPQTIVQVGNRHYAVDAVFLTPGEGAKVMAAYAVRHPRTARRLCAFMGLAVDGSAASFQEAGTSIPFVRLDSSGQHMH